MSTTIESLELELKSNSQSAASGIDALSASLEKLRQVTKGGLGLSSLVKNITALSAATNGISSTSVNNLSGLAKAIQTLKGVKLSSTISTQIASIGNSIKGLATVNMGDANTKIRELVTALAPLSTMPKQNISSTLSQLKKIPDIFNTLNGVDMNAFSQKIQELVTALKPLADEMDKIAAGFSAFPSKIQKLIASTNKWSLSNNTASGSYINLYAKLKMAYGTAKQVASVIASLTSKMTSYYETINLFSVSMGQYAVEAKKYVDTVSELMGIDPKEWMSFQGTIMTLATGFGIASDRAYIMSQQLTQLSYDIASFREIGIEDAMLKVQSGFAGELEPLRAIGYDLSQARLEAIAFSLGIDKSVSSMTQAEKAQLRYYAIMTQVTTAQGDMARTLDSPANQLRIFKAQVEQAGRAIGSIFIPILNKMLPYAIAFTKVIREIASSIAALFGFEMPEVDYSELDSVGNVAGDLDDATESAKKLKKYMMGFDELNVIDPTSGSGDGSGGFDFELPTYNFIGDATESRVATIVDEMKEWLGITDDITSWADLLNTRFGDILRVAGLIGAEILAWKVTKGFIDTLTAIKLLLANPTYAIAIGATLTLTGFAISFIGMKDAIRDGLDGFNFAEIVGNALLGAGGAAALGVGIGKWLVSAFSGSAVTKALTTAAINLFGINGPVTAGAVSAAGGAIAAGVAGIVAGIPMFITGIYDAIKHGIDWLSATLVGVGATAAGAGIGVIIGACGGPIGAGIGALIGLAVGAVTDLVILIVQKWDEISTFFVDMWGKVCEFLAPIGEWFDENVIQPVCEFFKGLWEDVSGFFKGLWEDICEIWDTVSTWFDENVIQPVCEFFEGAALRIGQFLEGCWLIIRAVWEIASTWFDETVVQPVVENFEWCKEQVTEKFTKAKEFVIEKWNDLSTWFDETVVQPVVSNFKFCKDEITKFFTEAKEFVIEKWNDLSTWFSEIVIDPVSEAFRTACENIGNFFSNLWSGIKTGVAAAMNVVIGSIETALNWVIGGINKLIKGFNDLVQWAADILGEDWGGVSLINEVELKRIKISSEESGTGNFRIDRLSKFANGGFPVTGEMFIAREAGPEMVGSIGNRTAVANNDQIVAGIASGVAEANGEQNALLAEQNALLRAILEKNTGVYLDGRAITNSVEKYQRERGRVLVTGGVL